VTRFIRFTLTQRVLLNLFFVLLMVVGAWAMLRSPVERYPNIHFGKVYIDTFYPGASPADVESLVTRVIEDALEDMDDMEYIMSQSYRERSSILVKFLDDTDYEKGYDELRFRVQGIIQDLPAEIDPPRFNFLDVNDWFPAISVNIIGDRSNRALTLIAEDLKPRLAQIDGLKEIKLVGEYTREFHILLDPDRMQANGITFDQATTALARANIIVPAGDFITGTGELMIRVDERFRSRDQIMETIIRTDGDGSFVRIADIATDAFLSHRKPFVISSVNGRDCVSLQLIKTRAGNAVRIVDELRKIIADNQDRYAGEGVQLTLTQDSTVKIKDSMRVLGINLLLGVILVSLLIWAVMGLRNAALTTVGIPFAFLVTMAIMYLTGNSINEMSLFSFVLVSGIIVDDAIIVVENIYRHVQMGKNLEDAVVSGTSEVFLPVISATLTTIAAFLPMLIMSGSIGEFFAVIPMAVSYALTASLIECLLILPIHYLDYGPRRDQGAHLGSRYIITSGSHSFSVEDTPFMSLTRRFFNRMLETALQFKKSAVLLLLVLFFIALFIALVSVTGKMNLIRITFFPDDYSIYYVEVEGPIGTPIETTHQLIKNIADAVMKDGAGMATSAAGMAGFYLNEDYMAVWGHHLGHVIVTLPALKKRHFEDYPANDILAHLDTMHRKLAHFTDSGFSLRIRPEKDGPPSGKDVNIRIMGSHTGNVRNLSRKVLSFLSHDPGLGPNLLDLQDDQGSPGRVLRFKILREQAAEYGLSTDKVASLAASVLNGRLTGKYRLNDEEIDIKVLITSDPAQGLQEALMMPVIDHADGAIRLADLCIPEFSVEAGFLNRYQGRRAVTITGNIRPGSNISSQSVVDCVKTWYATIQDAYPGATLNFAGEYESTRRSFTSLSYAFLLALLLIYLILATQFHSYLQPLIIISTVVFALIGIIYGTFFARSLFTINSFMAIVGVTGVVVNDSLVLIEFINKSYASGLSMREAVVAGTNIRLRPIILTTLTTTLGLLPMALGIPEYSLIWGTMAMTFVTGLCTATFLTIIVVPVEWEMLTAWRQRKNPEPPVPAQEMTITIQRQDNTPE
jgi:HAE1 family hydrophobic/amphiphilic exporter-1